MFRYRNGQRGLWFCAAAVALVWLSSPRSAADDAKPSAREARVVTKASAETTKRASKPKVDVQRALLHGKREGTKWVAREGDTRIELTLSAALQERARQIFEQYQVPYAAMAAIEPSTGRLLGYVGSSHEKPTAADPVRDPSPPAASVFKLVTAAALVDAGVSPSQRTCYSGGSSGIAKVHLQDNPARERTCANLDEALGKSLNAVFAKLADRHLDVAKLHSYGRAFGFGHALPFELAPPASSFEVPGDRLEFARTAAGFWHTHMSTLHAALIAATIANDGAMPIPYAVQQIIGPGDTRTIEPGRRGSRRVISPQTARAVGHMMLRTVTDGTSRSAFLDARGRTLLPGIAVAGKTGSLSDHNPFRAYSWWVGFAPADKPRIALAVLVVNGALWRIKSSFVARELLREYFASTASPRLAGRSPSTARARE